MSSSLKLKIVVAFFLVFSSLLGGFFLRQTYSASLGESGIFFETMEAESSGVDFVGFFTPRSGFDPGSELKISFPDSGEGDWCLENEQSLNVVSVSNSDIFDYDSELPGSLSAQCFQDSEGDYVKIGGIGELTSGTTYAFEVEGHENFSTAPDTGNHHVLFELSEGSKLHYRLLTVRLITNSTVGIQAHVSDADSVVCTISTNELSLGVLYRGGSFVTASHTIGTSTTGESRGYYWSVFGKGDDTDAGLYNSGTGHLIKSIGNTVNLLGDDGFGLVVEGPSGSNVPGDFQKGEFGVFGSVRAGFDQARMILYRETPQTEHEEATITIGARASLDADAGSYQEILTYSCGGYVGGYVPLNLVVSPTELHFDSEETVKTFEITNTGTGILEWEIGEPVYGEGGVDWIKEVDPMSGSTRNETDAVAVVVDREGLDEGAHEAEIPITSLGGGSHNLLVTLARMGVLPLVDTLYPSNIETNSADTGGDVTDDGGSAITARGVCWSTDSEPTVEDDCTDDGEGMGVFTNTITGLNPGTKYYIRAFAENNQGVAYGSERNFVTREILSVNPSNRAWDNTDVSVNITASGEGILGLEHCWTLEGSCSPHNFEESVDITTTRTETGEWTLCHRYVDVNEEKSATSCNSPYRIDKEGPELYASNADQGWTAEELIAVVNVTDAHSGVAQVRYSWDEEDMNEGCTSGEITAHEAELAVPSEGATLYLCARDNAGNVSTWSGEYQWTEGQELLGYAWSENIGWISFSCKNDDSCEEVEYGVKMTVDSFSGYAWSEHVGWLKFNPGPDFDTEEYPSSPHHGGKLDLDGSVCGMQYDICGWARFCGGTVNDDCESETDEEWDGWVKLGHLEDVDDSVHVDPETGALHGWAWGGDHVGWISFSCETDDTCEEMYFGIVDEEEPREYRTEAPFAPTLDEVINTTIILNTIEDGEYRIDGGDWQDSVEFSGLEPLTTYDFQQRYKATETHHYSPVSETASFMTSKYGQDAPAEAPTLDYLTDTTIVLNTIEDGEYRVDGGSWQVSEEFTGLNPNQTYTFEQRYAEQEWYNPSPPSPSADFTTDRSTRAAPDAPTVDFVTETTITLDSIEEGEYRIDGGDWQESVEFTGLESGETYTVEQRYKQTETYFASDASPSIDVTTTYELAGYAWSGNIGWISFNCENDDSCNEVEYSVKVSYDIIEGYAWSEHVGWLKLDPDSDFDTGDYPESPQHSVMLDVDGDTCEEENDVCGWARFCAGTTGNDCASETEEDWNGWVKFGPFMEEEYGVYLDPEDRRFHGWAWGGDHVGWISMSCETDDSCATHYYGLLDSEDLKEYVTEAPSAPTLDDVIFNTIILNTIEGGEYRIVGEEWQESPEFSDLDALTAYDFQQRYKETETHFHSPASEIATFSTNKYAQEAPEAPTKASRTDTSITLDAITNGEYRKDGGDWQGSPEFTGLNVNQTYTFEQRYAEQELYNASNPSPSADFTTDKSTRTAPDPTASSVTETTITLNLIDDGEYRIDGGDWQDSVEFTELHSATTYTVEQRHKETEIYHTSEITSADITTVYELTGYAWSETVGWISFNCENDNSCGEVEYSVTVTYDTLEGYAWSEHVGWLKFNPDPDFDTGDYPSGPQHTARLDVDGTICGEDVNDLCGWTRFCAGTENNDCESETDEDWNGWVKLGHFTEEENSVHLDTTDFSLHGWAWGSDNIGWISMSCDTEDICEENDYGVAKR